LAKTVDQIAESDEILRIAVGMPDRLVDMGNQGLPLSCRYLLCFCTVFFICFVVLAALLLIVSSVNVCFHFSFFAFSML